MEPGKNPKQRSRFLEKTLFYLAGACCAGVAYANLVGFPRMEKSSMNTAQGLIAAVLAVALFVGPRFVRLIP